MDKEKRLKKLLKELEERTGMNTSRIEKELIPQGEETGIKARKKKKI